MRKRVVVTMWVRERGTIGPGIWQGGSFVSMGLRRLPWPAIRQGQRQMRSGMTANVDRCLSTV
jgi:hypothetical protein